MTEVSPCKSGEKLSISKSASLFPWYQLVPAFPQARVQSRIPHGVWLSCFFAFLESRTLPDVNPMTPSSSSPETIVQAPSPPIPTRLSPVGGQDAGLASGGHKPPSMSLAVSRPPGKPGARRDSDPQFKHRAGPVEAPGPRPGQGPPPRIQCKRARRGVWGHPWATRSDRMGDGPCPLPAALPQTLELDERLPWEAVGNACRRVTARRLLPPWGLGSTCR